MTNKSILAMATMFGLAISGTALADSSNDGERGDDNGGSNYQWQDGEQGHSDGGSNSEWDNGDHGNNDSQSTSRVYMGMSDKAPPNANAANSQGTRTEVTTWRGYRHHYRDWDRSDRSVYITDYPGKKH
jgi:hypothetical protein